MAGEKKKESGAAKKAAAKKEKAATGASATKSAPVKKSAADSKSASGGDAAKSAKAKAARASAGTEKAPPAKAAEKSAKAPARKTSAPAAAKTAASERAGKGALSEAKSASVPKSGNAVKAAASGAEEKSAAKKGRTEKAPSAKKSSARKKAAASETVLGGASEKKSSERAAALDGEMSAQERAPASVQEGAGGEGPLPAAASRGAGAAESASQKGGVKKGALFLAAAVLLAAALFFGARGLASAKRDGSGGSASARANTLALAQKYIDKGQFDKAMDLLNGLLILDPNDSEADALLDTAIQLKKESDERLLAQSSGGQPGDSSYNISIDTDELTAALREQNERSQKMINDLLEQQRQSQNARQEEAAEKKAAEELKKKEEAERKAAEEALAKKNAAIKETIKGINERISSGKADLNAGNVDAALKNFEGAVSPLPLSEGEPAFSASKYSEIASALFDASSAEKDSAKKERLRAAAIQYVNKSLAVNPSDPAGHYILGMSYGEASPPNWQKAAEELQKAAAAGGNNYMYWYQLGRAQFRLKKYAEARNAFETAAKCNKDFDLAYYNLGITCKRLGLQKPALDAFRSAFSANPQNAKAKLEEARLLNDAYKDSAGAAKCYEKVIELDPVNLDALNECGVVYSSMGQYAKAEATHRKAVALLPPDKKDPVTYYNLSLSLYNQKKYADAQKYARLSYEQMGAMKSAKEKAVVAYNYALVEDALGDSEKAIALYKEVLSLDPDNVKTKTNLGVMLMSMDPPDADAALSFFLDAYKTEKSFELENNLGSAYLAKKDYANAVARFQNALKKSPSDASVRFNLAKAYSGAGDFDNARTTYEEILRADQNNYDSYIELAKVFIALGDTASAQSYLKILQQKNPTYKKAEVDRLLAATAG